MFFIGVITNQKNEIYIKKELEHIISNKNIIFITEKNVGNIKNIKFETILLDTQINNKKDIRKIISSSKYLILNSDIKFESNAIEDLNLKVISYGFNSKSTFTISSIDENDLIICLQRIIFSKNNIEIEPQEYKIKNSKSADKYAIIGINIIKIIYE